ncbi:lipoprotein, YaeC family [Geodermatophilus africanus]|uniref:Lipoprotein, YaeC family n=1 Tax=Geodermatophilus africanus TaxID=1137993 RepID=A0A1H3AQS6_9ACTN|nr:MetQ/NlpA family ABC transporter substrate-binding protein [Geodermatophilus africanus]SDX31761.1 lipoprotein, YaeC family [Geodermatophilus africanus]
MPDGRGPPRDRRSPGGLEALGIYSESLTDLAALPDGATVAIPNDPTNAARALRLLEANGLLTLADTGDAAPTSLDVEGNPEDLQISEVEAAQVPRSLADVDIAVINGNYAIEADLVPAEDALALEEAEGTPNANLLVVRTGTQDDERIQQLEELLHSDEVRQFIEQTYEGAVVPAVGRTVTSPGAFSDPDGPGRDGEPCRGAACDDPAVADLRTLLADVAARAAEYRAGVRDVAVFPRGEPAAAVRAGLGSLRDEGADPAAVLAELAAAAEPGLVATTGPRSFRFVVGGALDSATAADVPAVAGAQPASDAVTYRSTTEADVDRAVRAVAAAWGAPGERDGRVSPPVDPPPPRTPGRRRTRAGRTRWPDRRSSRW